MRPSWVVSEGKYQKKGGNEVEVIGEKREIEVLGVKRGKSDVEVLGEFNASKNGPRSSPAPKLSLDDSMKVKLLITEVRRL